ncbi:uncharacterized protein TRIADDRAFT_33784 [Trichoplax adhaerens]|uniref:SRCR domain-containing protein n=1 Tax=Trichoplax adhaerens TaxID=10228 RepID=B3SD88_TRIAD|nr:hypothetical protein TRIADDRAFT_33784 [Trichoplax adhaerens]EDV19298.1 hypothetical protein TRIADDRAFT_33784 [Trichoplax adhaerens]|eukprot:XP_002118222.1 hypothetical protein TRIADDRAFT_33784 [Trichoplax adhaerens]
MDGDLRLVGGHDHDEGKIEVYYRGLWAGICDDYFDQRDANVICRQLGYRAVIDYFCCSKFNDTEAYGYTSNQTLFWLDHLECEGHEKNIMECSHEGWGNHDCSSHESSGVRCTIHSCISSPCSANATCHDEIDGEYSCQYLRMVYGYNQNAEGLIQVYHEGLWGTICIVDFDINEANVICRQLGFQGALFARESGLSNQIGHGRIWLSKLVCKGVERSIRDCFQKQWTRRHCEHSMDVILRCTDQFPVYTALYQTTIVHLLIAHSILPVSILLISYANNDDRGLVEIYINGSWGTICDDYFTIDVGHVLCRQLGYIGFVEYKCCSTWGSGRGRIWIEKINCSGNENHILDCRIDNNQDQYCNHREDVGIHCTGYTDDILDL